MAAPQAFNVSVRPAATQDRKGLYQGEQSSPPPYIPMPEDRGFTATFGKPNVPVPFFLCFTNCINMISTGSLAASRISEHGRRFLLISV